jgi:PAS domain S-box-containing protein
MTPRNNQTDTHCRRCGSATIFSSKSEFLEPGSSSVIGGKTIRPGRKAENTVLVVNDIPDLLELMSHQLRESGYHVITALDGQEGLEIAEAERPDLVISDVAMPRMNGIELCRRLRAHSILSATPVLLVSANRKDSETVIEGLKAGADDYLEAPYDPMLLMAKVAQLVERKRIAEALLESETRLAGIVDSAMDAIITVDEGQRILLFNRAAERLFRCTAVSALGESLDRFLPERFHATHPSHIHPFSQTGVTTRAMAGARAVHGLRGDGEEFPLEVAVSQVEVGGQKLFTVIMRDITERQRAEEEHRLLAAIVESSDDAIFSKTLDGRITSWNASAEKMYGYTAEEAIGQQISFITPPERSDEPALILDRLRRGERIRNLETVRISKDGRRVDVAKSISPIIDRSGRVVGASTIARDITQRKRTEEALRESEERLRLAIEATKLGIWDLTPQTGKRRWSDRCKAIFGVPDDAEIKETIFERIHPDDRGPLNEAVQSALDPEVGGELHIEYRVLVGEDNVERWVESHGRAFFEEGRAVRLIGTMLDITERKYANQSLRESEERLRLALEAAGTGTWDYRFETGEIIWDERGFRNFGFSQGISTYDSAVERIHPDDRTAVEEENRRVLAGKNEGAYHQEFRVIWPDGSVHWLASHGRVHSDGNGESHRAVRFIGINTDITERKQAEVETRILNEALEERVAERTAQLQAVNRELEAFSYSVSHDLRAPLRHINGFSQALLEDYADELDEVGKSYLQELRGASQEMAQLIDDVLQLARVTRSDMRREVVNLSELTHVVIAELQKRDPERTVAVQIEEGLVASGDKRLLRIALSNLIGNAWKFTSKREHGELTFGKERKGAETVYLVRDNGAGFNMEYAGKLFGAFQRLHTTREFEGTGIGLATVQRIINRHGGRVWAEGAIDQGATFYFTLAGFREMNDEKQSNPPSGR